MAVNFLPLDDTLLMKPDSWDQDKDTFLKVAQHYLDTKYTGVDSAAVYGLFSDEQKKLLNSYFRGFSVESYRDLNGQVELQIQTRDAKVKAKIKTLEEAIGIRFNPKDWVYDGMVDSGKDSGVRCDLCPHPIRYAHFAVNKTTHDCLRFGCACAGDFFNIDKNALGSLRTIQANTLRDLKYIAFVMENKQATGYYRYVCGKTGQIMLGDGIAGILRLLAFEVDPALLSADQSAPNFANQVFECTFSSGKVEPRPVSWIKENIILCVNADLDDNYGVLLEERKLIPLKMDGKDIRSLNVHPYLGMASRFVHAGLPLPLSLCKRINKALAVGASTHHVDYISFAKELLISKNLRESAVLTRAFSEFIGNYYASVNTGHPRDPELAQWGIRGPKTFYNTVLEWESIYRVLQASLSGIAEIEKHPTWSARAYGFRCDNRCSTYRNFLTARDYFLEPDEKAISLRSDGGTPKFLVNGNVMPVKPDDAVSVYFTGYQNEASFVSGLVAHPLKLFETFGNNHFIWSDKVVGSQLLAKVSEDTKVKYMASMCSALVSSNGLYLSNDKLREIIRKPEHMSAMMSIYDSLFLFAWELAALKARVWTVSRAYAVASKKSDRIKDFENISELPDGDDLGKIIRDFVKLTIPGRVDAFNDYFNMGNVGLFSLILPDMSVFQSVLADYVEDPTAIFEFKIESGDKVNRDNFAKFVAELEEKKVKSVPQVPVSDDKGKLDSKKDVATAASVPPVPPDVESEDYKRLYALVQDRLAFFNCDIAGAKKKDSSLSGKTDGAVRRAQMKRVKFLRSFEEGLLFAEELRKPLPKSVSLSAAAAGVLDEFEKNGKRVDKKMVEVFRTECYNDGLIFTASKALAMFVEVLDTKVLRSWLKSSTEASLVKDLVDVLGTYYVMRSDLLRVLPALIQLADTNKSKAESGTLQGVLDLVQLGELPAKTTSVQGILDAYNAASAPDAAGLTGVDKAKAVVAAKNNGTLPSFQLDICKTVAARGTCSPKQLVYVDQAYITLGLSSDKKADGKPVKKALTHVDPNSTSASTPATASTSTPVAVLSGSSDSATTPDDTSSDPIKDAADARKRSADVVRNTKTDKVTVRVVNQCKKICKSDGFWGLSADERKALKAIADGSAADADTLAVVKSVFERF